MSYSYLASENFTIKKVPIVLWLMFTNIRITLNIKQNGSAMYLDVMEWLPPFYTVHSSEAESL